VRISLLGHMCVVHQGTELALPSSKQRTLLALLAVNLYQPVATEVIMAELWPEPEQSVSRATLRSHIFQLRKSLSVLSARAPGSIGIEAAYQGYRLVDADGEIDTETYARLVSSGHSALKEGDDAAANASFGAALAEWRGPALTDVAHGPRLASFVRRIEESRLSVLVYRAELSFRLGLHREVLPELAGLVESHPLDEGIAMRFMVALYRCERRADALAYYQVLRRRFSSELGLEPSARIQRLHQAILNTGPVDELLNPV
jgi:DNA-binding SARP family transcriptional activator